MRSYYLCHYSGFLSNKLAIRYNTAPKKAKYATNKITPSKIVGDLENADNVPISIPKIVKTNEIPVASKIYFFFI